MEVMMPELLDSMAQNTEDISSNDNILAIFSNIDEDLRYLGPSSPALSTDPEVLFPPNFQTYLPSPASFDEQDSFDSTSTIEASDNDPTVGIASTAGVQFLADNSNEDQFELSPANPFQPLVALCTAHTLMAITSVFSSTHMVWTPPLEKTPQLCSPYSLATKMVY